MLARTRQQLLFFLSFSLGWGEVLAAHCAYINAYHTGYEWSDRMQQAFEQTIQPQCHITTYYLDAKHATEEQLLLKGREVAESIASTKPNIVIAADDASSAYVVQPYLRNTSTPVVYVGINWDPRPYGYPMDNATGMTEVWPTNQALRILRHTLHALNKLTIISADNPLEKTDSAYIGQSAQKQSIAVERILVGNFADWKKAVVKAQDADAIYLGTNQSIQGWNKAEAVEWLKKHNSRFTFASHDFMRPYVMFSLAKSPEEFGIWAAKLSSAILNGNQPWQIPIIPNHKFIPFINESLMSLTHYELPAYVKRNALIDRIKHHEQ